MEIIYILVVLFCGVCLPLFCIYFDDIISYIKSKSIKHTITNTPITKKIVEHKNAKNNIYYVVWYNGYSTEIKWRNKKDAEFYYAHISKMPYLNYIYQSIHQQPYYIIYMDKCKLYVVPEYETEEHHYIHNIVYNTSDNDKYVYYLYKWNNPHQYKSLESMYNNIIATDYYEETVILSTEQEQVIDKKIDDVIASTKELQELKAIIQEYKDTVNLSNKIAEKLCKL